MAKEDYLRKIYYLTDEGESSTSTSELAEAMDVTNASASEAVKKLEGDTLVCRAAYKGFTLSPIGKDEASKLAEKNERLEEIFREASVSSPEEEADRVEHCISIEALESLEEKIL